MIRAIDLSFTYKNSTRGSLKKINFMADGAELVLVTGASGCGKSTLLRTIDGLIPHFYKGELCGELTLDSENPAEQEIYKTALKVGSIFQNPKTQFFNVDTTSEIVYALENQGLPENEIRGRLNEVSRQLGLEGLLDRNIFGLSGGEKQLVACAGVSVTDCKTVVMDEPSSNLDMDAIKKLRDTIRVWKEQGRTVIISEHRIFYLKGLIDRLIVMQDGGIVKEMSGDEADVLTEEQTDAMNIRPMDLARHFTALISNMDRAEKDFASYKIENMKYCYNENHTGIEIASLELKAGAVVGVIGHNGAGKSTFARCLTGLEKKCRGSVLRDGRRMTIKDRVKTSFMVMQDVNLQLFSDSVQGEAFLSMCRAGERKHKWTEREKDIVIETLKELGLYELKDRHPMSLSGGQKQRVAILDAVVSKKDIIVFDEPTSGLDLGHMKSVSGLLNGLAAEGKLVIVITHDAELLVSCCDKVLHIEGGRVFDYFDLNDSTLDKISWLYS